MAKNKIYSRISSHVCDDDGNEWDFSTLMSDEEFAKRKKEAERILAEHWSSREVVYNPQIMKMEVVSK